MTDKQKLEQLKQAVKDYFKVIYSTEVDGFDKARYYLRSLVYEKGEEI